MQHLHDDEKRYIYFFLEYDEMQSLSQTNRQHRAIFQSLREDPTLHFYSRKAFYKRKDSQEWGLYIRVTRQTPDQVCFQTTDYGYLWGKTWPMRKSYYYFLSPNLLKIGSPQEETIEHALFRKTYQITQDGIPPEACAVTFFRATFLYFPLYTMFGCFFLIYLFCLPFFMLFFIFLLGFCMYNFHELVTVDDLHMHGHDGLFFF